MLTCWFYRREISRSLDSGEALPEATAGHLQHCGSCRSFHELNAQITKRLIEDAPREQRSASPFLQAKIIAALKRAEHAEEVPEAHAARRPQLALWAATGASLIVLAAFLISTQLPPRTDSASPNPAATSPGVPSPLLTQAGRLPSGETILAWSRKWEEPLETELDLVIRDAKTALNGLARNFLPGDLLASLDR